MTATSQPWITPVRKTAFVPQPPDEAFRLFTDEIAEWWPLGTHSVGLHTATSVVFERSEGGQIVETYGDGHTAVWGTVLVWNPPSLVRFTWHPGTTEAHATEVEVRFKTAAGGTAVELIHTGWEQRPDAVAARENYQTGWDLVFGRYATAASGGLTSI